MRTITGRSLAEIAELGRPGRLSDAGFLGADEDVASILKADNRVVASLGLTHPELARPLFHAQIEAALPGRLYEVMMRHFAGMAN